MKTKILLIATIASLIFTACQKEDESENPYSDGETGKTYDLSTEDMRYFPYKENDSIAFINKNKDNLEGDGFERYYYTSQIESGYEELKGNKYQYYKIKLAPKDENYDYWTFRLQKTIDGIEHIVKTINDNFIPTVIYELNEQEAFYSTITINNIEYNDVYYYLYDYIGNYWNDTTLYEKYYFAKDKGIVCMEHYYDVDFLKE